MTLYTLSPEEIEILIKIKPEYEDWFDLPYPQNILVDDSGYAFTEDDDRRLSPWEIHPGSRENSEMVGMCCAITQILQSGESDLPDSLDVTMLEEVAREGEFTPDYKHFKEAYHETITTAQQTFA